MVKVGKGQRAMLDDSVLRKYHTKEELAKHNHAKCLFGMYEGEMYVICHSCYTSRRCLLKMKQLLMKL